MLEVAIGFPVFLLILVFIMWVSFIYFARGSLTVAVEQSIRLAGTRGNQVLMGWPDAGNGLLPPLEAIESDRDLDAAASLLVYNVDLDVAKRNYIGWFPSDFSVVPKPYWYFLAYVGEEMKAKIGALVRYPCDPMEEPPLGGPGCLRCYFPNSEVVPLDEFQANYGIMSVVCDYMPGDPFTKFAAGLMRAILGNAHMPRLIIKHRASMDSPPKGWDTMNPPSFWF